MIRASRSRLSAGHPASIQRVDAGEHATDGDNVELLLSEMRDLEGTVARRARFCCVLVLARPDGSEVVVRGEVAGSIATAPRGRGGSVMTRSSFPPNAEGLPSLN